MKKYINGVYRDMTDEEVTAMQKQQASYEAAERTRPLTESEVTAMLIRQQINSLAVDDNTALRMREFYPDWAAGQDYPAGFKVQRGGALYKVLQAHTSQDGWEPENAPALWTEICESHAGTLTDPIPYSGNMALESGKYYSQSGAVYLCTRDTVNPAYSALADLVPQAEDRLQYFLPVVLTVYFRSLCLSAVIWAAYALVRKVFSLCKRPVSIEK